MRAIAKYTNLEEYEYYTNENEISIRHDSVLIVKKPYIIKDNSLDRIIDNLEKKLDLILRN